MRFKRSRSIVGGPRADRLRFTTDTATDLIWDTIGSAGSATIRVLWSLGNHSLRRRPGVALADKPFGSFLKASTR